MRQNLPNGLDDRFGGSGFSMEVAGGVRSKALTRVGHDAGSNQHSSVACLAFMPASLRRNGAGSRRTPALATSLRLRRAMLSPQFS